jgi:alpha-beta hydrolase superfamily lysophospholipase
MKSATLRLLKRLALYLAVALAGFIGGGLALYIVIIRSGPTLQLWHTEKLTAEFTAQETADTVQTFQDYLQLEDTLFTQLDERIYHHPETGPDFALARYSSGSLADPHTQDTDWNRTFELPANNPKGGVLLLHGMSDSPYSLRVLGETLNKRGYWVIGLRYPGHGTAPSGLVTVTWEDMAAAVDLAMTHLASKTNSQPLHMVGYSTGAPLAVNYTLENLEKTLPASLILISPSIGITPAAALAGWKNAMAKIPGLENFAWTQIIPEFDPFKYNSFTANAGDQVHRLTRSVTAKIQSQAAHDPIESFPRTLVFLSTVDATVSTDAVIDNLFAHLAPNQHELVLFDINRTSVKSTILVSDPGPLTARLLQDDSLPFHLSLVSNEKPDSTTVVNRRKTPSTKNYSTEILGLAWPRGVISLSHVALPFPPDDPLYGRREFAPENGLQLGQIDVQGERNLIKFPADWLLRLRYNPFYEFLENRTLEWINHSTP